jgi:hypothetical protein
VETVVLNLREEALMGQFESPFVFQWRLEANYSLSFYVNFPKSFDMMDSLFVHTHLSSLGYVATVGYSLDQDLHLELNGGF